MRRAALGLLVLAGCHPSPGSVAVAPRAAVAPAEAPAEPVQPAPPAERAVEAPSIEQPDRRTIASSPFGCETIAVTDPRTMERFLPAGTRGSFDDEDRLPTREHRRLLPRADRLRVVGPDGPCEPRLGEARAVEAPTDVTMLRQSFAGCGNEVASIAFTGCDVPGWLRYRRLESHIETLPRTGALEDPLLEALAARPTELRGTPRRRARRSVATSEREELVVLELHRYLDGRHPCDDDEELEVSVHVRSVSGDAPGPWREVRSRGRIVGVYFDDHGLVVGLDTRVGRDRCEHAGWDCNTMAIEGPPGDEAGATLATVDYGFGGNLLWHDDGSPVLHARDCDQSGY